MFAAPPGYMSSLQRQLEALDASTFERINRQGGFEVSDLLDAVGRPKSHDVYDPGPLEPSDVIELGSSMNSLAEMGHRLLADGKVAVVGLTDDVVAPRWRLSSTAGPGLLRGYESLRLMPDNGLLVEDGRPSFHSCGTGDVIPALVNSGELAHFLAQGGRYIVVSTCPVPPELIGYHATAGVPITCGIVPRVPGHENVVCMHSGFNQLVHRHRFVTETSDDIRWAWSGSMVVDALLDFRNVEWKWHRRKKIRGMQLVIEHERHIEDLTATFKTQFVRLE